MNKIIIFTFAFFALISCSTAPKGDRTVAQANEGFCFNAVTGQTADCRPQTCYATDSTGRMFPGQQFPSGRGFGPCIAPAVENSSERDCEFNHVTVKNRDRAVEAFSTTSCTTAKVEYRQCVDGVLLGSFPFPECR